MMHLPDVGKYTKQDMLNVLLREEYGQLPPAPDRVEREVAAVDSTFCAGKADLVKLQLRCRGAVNFDFPVQFVCPKKAPRPVPCLIHLNFRPDLPDRYQPTEELVDRGYSVMTLYYEDVTRDNGDFTDGLAGVVYPGGVRTPAQCGKIGLWAWAALRMVETARTMPEVDRERITVIGHSRLGKTALLVGALEERLYCAVSNDSGCSGAALARGKTGERIRDIYRRFPYWFSTNYEKYVENEAEMPFDQHFLLAANFPHRVYVASARADAWACPANEYESCRAASPFFEKQGRPGFRGPAALPEGEACFHEGWIGYHIREGQHYLSRQDWHRVMDYLERAHEG